MAKPTREFSGRGFVLSHTPTVIARMKAEEAARRREVDAWARDLDRGVPASALNQADKNAVWREVKASHPDHRAFLEDPVVQQLMRAGAVPCFPPELIRSARHNTRKETA